MSKDKLLTLALEACEDFVSKTDDYFAGKINHRPDFADRARQVLQYRDCETSKQLGIALLALLQGDYSKIEEFARNCQIDFIDGEPYVRSW